MKSITEVVQNLLKPYIDGKIETLTNNKVDKSGDTMTGNLSIVRSTAGTQVSVTYNNQSTSKANVAALFADNEGGNLSLSKENNTGRIQLDTQPMNGSSGYARMLLGDTSSVAKKVFKFNEDGSFIDGNGNNLSTEVNKIPYFPNSGWTELSNAVMYKKSGGLVYLRGTFGKDILVTNGSLSIGTLPSECRPYSTLWIPCGAELDPAILKVNTDGTVVLQTARTTSFYLCLCATFPVQL